MPTQLHKLDFLGIGAAKAGTTSLFEYLKTHPHLYLPPAKEESFFSEHEAFRRGWEEFAGVAFANAPESSLWGKVSPRYMLGALTKPAVPSDHPERVIPGRIADLFPRVKLIALLRDPVDRAISDYWESSFRGFEQRPPNKALQEQLDSTALREARLGRMPSKTYITTGEYGRILAGFLHHFAREQLFVASTALLAEEPMTVLTALWRFLGIDPNHRPENLGDRYRTRATGRRLERLDPKRVPARVRQGRVTGALWNRIPLRARNRIRSRYRQTSYRIEMWNRARTGGDEPVDPEIVARLRAHFREDLVLLHELVGPVPGLTNGSEPTMPNAAAATGMGV